MDFGSVGVEGLVVGTSSAAFLDPEAKQRLCGSRIFKTDKSSASADEWRSSKMAQNEGFSFSKAMQRSSVDVPSMITSKNLSSSNSLFLSAAARQEQQNMLCFSSPKTECALPCYTNYDPVSAAALWCNYSGFNLGSLSSANHHGGGFTPSQWMELEQQALIYKYINANIPVPSNLLSPIKKAFESAGFSFYHGGSLLRPNHTNALVGWGGFHLGFSGSSDPEPGRCRRTDGKKWRCSKDAMPDQKYCDRHMNRGRHRSRKPVEGQSAHPHSGATLTTTAKKRSATLLPPAASAASVGAGGGLSTATYNTSEKKTGGLSLSADNDANRFFLSKHNVVTEKSHNSTSTSSNDIKSKDSSFLMMKYGIESSIDNIGSDSSNTLFGNLGTLKELTDTETNPHYPIHHRFMNDWTSPEIHISSIQSGSTAMVSSSHPENLPILPLNLGIGSFAEDPKFHTNWVPISVGGPLGEVLQNANSSSSSSTECKNSSGLNLMMDGWERSSPAGSYSSPTAVLQKSSFESVSNSSAGSSPRAT